MPFVKLDTRILDSTLWIKRDLREVFITALLMAEPMEFDEPQRQIEVDSLDHADFEAPPGWYGFVPAASFGIINRAGVDMEAGMVAIRKLGQPEIESRSPEFEGRRMIRINGGFLILNYMKYRDKDYTAKDRMARLRARRKEEKVTRNSNGVHPNVTQAESRVQSAEAEGERPPTPQNTETAAVARKALPVALTPMIDRIGQPYAQETHQHGIAPQEEAQYGPSADPLDNIPEGLALVKYAGFVAEQVGIPAGYGLKVKIGDTLGIMASGGPMAPAVRGLIKRMQAAGPQKWLFWLEDGGWKDDAGSNATEAAFLGGAN